MKKFFAFCLLSICFLPVAVHAEKVVFSLVGDFPPYQYEKDGQAVGSDVDLLREASARLGLDPQFHILPWKRALMYAEEGKVDAVSSILYTKERAEFLYYTTEPTHINRDSIMVRKDGRVEINDLGDLGGKRIGVISGYSYGPRFDSFKELKKEICNDQQTLIKILDKGRIDAAVAAEMPFLFNCGQMGLRGRFETAYVISENPTYMGFSKKAPGGKGKELAERFSEVLRALDKEGLTKKIMDKYR